jgi:hypothetical protein
MGILAAQNGVKLECLRYQTAPKRRPLQLLRIRVRAALQKSGKP